MSVGGQNTSWKHGTHGALTTNTDFQQKTRSVSLSLDQETVDATTFGDAYKDFESSFKNATAEATYKYDTAVWGQVADLYSNGETVTFEYGPDGNATGKPKISGSMFITKLGMPAQVGNLLEVSVSWQVTGVVSFSTF